MATTRIGHWTKLGSAIRDARTRHRWSQHDLARRADVSRSWLAKVEAGHRGAELEPLLRLLDALELIWTLSDAGTVNDTRTEAAQRPATPAPGWKAPPVLASPAITQAAVARAAAAARRRAAWASAGDAGDHDPEAVAGAQP